jgi:hypothetical protein
MEVVWFFFITDAETADESAVQFHHAEDWQN